MLFPCEYTQELKNKKTKFFRNILTLVKRSQNSSKIRFFYFCLKIHPLMCLFFTLRWHTVYDMVRDTFFLFFENRTSGNNLVIQLWPKMLRTNPISGFFDISGNLWRSLENSWYLWKEAIDILGFLRGVCHQGKAVYEITTFGWVWPVKSLAHSDFRILLSVIYQERINWYLSFSVWS